MDIQYCMDCHHEDDADRVDPYVVPFGDYWICKSCLHKRGVEF